MIQCFEERGETCGGSGSKKPHKNGRSFSRFRHSPARSQSKANKKCAAQSLIRQKSSMFQVLRQKLQSQSQKPTISLALENTPVIVLRDRGIV